MKFIFSLFLLAVGFALGFSAEYLVPDIIPTNIKMVEQKKVPVIGPVVSKERKKDSLLLTIDTDHGAMLATFNKKVDEINLLVSEGDTIELSPRRYEPFISNPKIKKVRKGRSGFQTSQAELPTLHPQKGIIEMPQKSDKEEPAQEEAMESSAAMIADEDVREEHVLPESGHSN